jgi:hypothetical protein
MIMTQQRSIASCLCGAVKLETVVGTSVGACHCDICRKWGGGAMLALNGGDSVRFEGGDNISVYPTTAWAERGFCAKCGTHLFIRVNQTGRYIIPAGLFDLDESLQFDHQIFIDKKPSYYRFGNVTREMTGAEVFAHAASQKNSL